MDKLRDENSKRIESVKEELQKMSDENMHQAKKEAKGEFKSAELRIRENQAMTITNEFMVAIKEYQRIQTNFKEKHREDLKRQVKISVKNISDEEAENMLDSENFSEETFYANQLMNTTAASTAKAVYAELKETRDDLLKLEASMNELAEV